MAPPLQTIHDIYLCMEQGNIGKLLTILDDSILVFTAACMGGNRRGREGILQLVPVFYRPGTGIAKVVESFSETAHNVVVTGKILLTGTDQVQREMPFADVWIFNGHRMHSAYLYYLDPLELSTFLSNRP